MFVKTCSSSQDHIILNQIFTRNSVVVVVRENIRRDLNNVLKVMKCEFKIFSKQKCELIFFNGK